jgi:hypothetical protein
MIAMLTFVKKALTCLVVLILIIIILNWYGMAWQPVVQPETWHAESSWKVGFAKVDITPDHESQDVYLAGFGFDRKATGMNDSLWARSIVLQNGAVTMGIVVLDLIGLFHDDVEIIRRKVYEQTDIDYLAVLTTHNHNSPDTMGLWGKSPIINGIDPKYQEFVRQMACMSVVQAYNDLKDAQIRIAQKQVDGLQRDSRIPYVYDTTVTTLVFESENEVIGSLVHWSNHPEALGGDNTIVTSDFPHYIRKYMEENLGGVCLYVNGAIGGLINPLRIEVLKKDGSVALNNSFEKAEAIGERVAEAAISSLTDAKVLTPSLKVSKVSTYLSISNPSFRLLALIGGIKRTTYWRELPFWRFGTHIKSEAGVLTMGELQIALVPGELFPELFYGGYLGPEEAAHPDIEPEPVIKDYMKGEINLVFGMANDEIGYIVPVNDFIYGTVLGERRKDRTGRSHYEETVSLGDKGASLLIKYLLKAM